MSERMTDAEIEAIARVNDFGYSNPAQAIRQLQQDLAIANLALELTDAHSNAMEATGLSARRYEALKNMSEFLGCSGTAEIKLIGEDGVFIGQITPSVREEFVFVEQQDSISSALDALADECIKRLGKETPNESR